MTVFMQRSIYIFVLRYPWTENPKTENIKWSDSILKVKIELCTFILDCTFIAKSSHPYVYSRPYVYCFLQIFPTVRLFQTVRLFHTLEYLDEALLPTYILSPHIFVGYVVLLLTSTFSAHFKSVVSRYIFPSCFFLINMNCLVNSSTQIENQFPDE